jgi:hypothetical protein
MMWRYGILYRACNLIESLAETPQLETELIHSFQEGSYRNVDIKDLINVSRFASWVTEGEGGLLVATEEGRRLLAADSDMFRMRMQVDKLIEVIKPDWIAMALHGRKAMLNYLDTNILQCFKEAGLAKGQDADVVEWWDHLAANSRGLGSYRNTEIGRRGERLSCEYELSRTGKWPIWIALEQAEVGFDLVSQVSREDKSSLVIEVKTTTRDWEYAKFFMSRNEWDVLYNHHPNARVHLWCLEEEGQPKSSNLNLEQLKYHVPQDTGKGKWEKFSCCFSEFNLLPY